MSLVVRINSKLQKVVSFTPLAVEERKITIGIFSLRFHLYRCIVSLTTFRAKIVKLTVGINILVYSANNHEYTTLGP